MKKLIFIIFAYSFYSAGTFAQSNFPGKLEDGYPELGEEALLLKKDSKLEISVRMFGYNTRYPSYVIRVNIYNDGTANLVFKTFAGRRPVEEYIKINVNVVLKQEEIKKFKLLLNEHKDNIFKLPRKASEAQTSGQAYIFEILNNKENVFHIGIVEDSDVAWIKDFKDFFNQMLKINLF